MVFSSTAFLFAFLPAALCVYFLCPKRHGLRNLVLLLFSLGFYGWGGWRLLPLLGYSILVNYLFGLLVAKEKRKKLRLTLAVILNLGLLFGYKYLGFATENLNRLFPALPVLNIALPIGVSFYTFQGLSYVIDVYRGGAAAEKNPLNVALYIALFPQLVAGPIVRYTAVSAELRQRQESLFGVSEGLQRFLLGLGKKLLLANPMAELADAVFAQEAAYLSTGMAWLGVIAYSAQIYFDFSGYSDMAIGLGRVFGFHFPENFNYPYLADSVTDFWRRWHISLSSWFRDYVYIPLGGNRCGKWKQLRNLLLVWLLTGIWHGAAWNYLLWGLYYGVLLILEKFVFARVLERLPKAIKHIYALLLIFVGWLIFRASGGEQTGVFLKAMCFGAADGAWNRQATYLLLEYRWELCGAVLFSFPVLPALRRALEKGKTKAGEFVLTWGAGALALVVGALSVLHLLASDFNPFIYFPF